MSSTTSEQTKTQENFGSLSSKGEEQNIPWSQQVSEASCENLSSPINESNNGSQNSAHFQNPPFGFKGNKNISWSYKNKKTNLDTKKYAKSYQIKKENNHQTPWNESLLRRPYAMNSAYKVDDSPQGKLCKDPTPCDVMEENKINSLIAPKKTTWALIASQPAKISSKSTFTTAHKKKGPGMPPPPMVPGKHNLDINSWDPPNNNVNPLLPSQIEVDDACVLKTVTDYSAITRTEKNKSMETSHQFSNEGSVQNYSNTNTKKDALKCSQGRYTGNMPTNEVDRNEKNLHSIGRVRSESRRNDISKNESLDNFDEYSEFIESTAETPRAILDKLRDKNNYNPSEIDLIGASTARFFVIKSYSEDDIHRSIKYEIWCSTDHGNKRLDDAFKERYEKGGIVLLFFSVNGSGHFCGMAQMMTTVDYNCSSSVWSQDKWKGKFKVRWIYVKDVPNHQFRNIRLENNENKRVTHSRDTQEVPKEQGIKVLQILHSYKHKTSLFDDFYHYEKRQEEEVSSKKPIIHDNSIYSQNQGCINRYRQSDNGSHKYGNATSPAYFRGNVQRNFHQYEHRRCESYRNVFPETQQSVKNDFIEKGNNEQNNRPLLHISRREDLKHNWEREFGNDRKCKTIGHFRTESKPEID